MQTVIDNILVNYEIHCEKNKKTILILHGWGQNLSHWQSVAKVLSQENKVILLDLPGFGSSSIPEKAFKTEDYVAFIEKFIQKFKLKDLIIIGHSVGGKIAIKLASYSKNINQLILISPSGIGSKPLLISVKIVIFKFLKLFLFWLPINLKKHLSSFFSSSDYLNAGKMVDTFRVVVNERIEDDAIKINLPVLIIWGENDKEINVKNAKILKRLIHKSILRIIWKVGHSPNIEASDKLSNLLLEYI